MKNLKDLTIAELETELARKKQEEQENKKRTISKLQTLQQKFITKEFVDAFAPDHERTSCSDEKLNNGFSSWSVGRIEPNCKRCALLEIVLHGESLEGCSTIMQIFFFRT